MSKISAYFIELTEDAQRMTRDAFIEKYGVDNVLEWHRVRDPDYYEYPEWDGYDHDY